VNGFLKFGQESKFPDKVLADLEFEKALSPWKSSESAKLYNFENHSKSQPILTILWVVIIFSHNKIIFSV
jgi:hypothetical protein